MTSKRTLVVSLALFAFGSIASATDVTQALTFVGITPCRIVQTFGTTFTGQAGPPSLIANTDRTFQITGVVPGVPAQCGIPTTAVAISVNFTVANFAGQGDLRVFPAGSTLPLVSIINYQLENIANATTVPLGPGGITIHCDAAGTDFIADVNGYYVPRPHTTLESGQTMTGDFAASGGTATAAGQFGWADISFPTTLASAPAAPAANFRAPGAAATANCPGSPTNPAAAAGQLCAYSSFCGSAAPTGLLFNPANGAANQANVRGGGVFLTSTAAGNLFCYGTWAVTAP
jgi:hypothetical protein